MIFTKRDLVFFFVLVEVSLGFLVFLTQDDFLYDQDLVQIKQMTERQIDTQSNDIGMKEPYYEQTIKGVYTNGKRLGKEVTLRHERTYSSVVTERYRVGDKVFVKDHTIQGLKRDQYVGFLIVLFVLAIFLVGRLKGLAAIFSVVVNTVLFYMGLSLYFNGLNLIVLCIVESIFFTVFSLLVTNGWNRKTLVAIVSVFLSTLLLLVLTFLVIKMTHYQGISFNDMSFLTRPYEDIFLAELMIGGLGAIMDICITMSSSLSELIAKDSTISTKALIQSGKEIGKDIMGTMTNVLFFTYLCSGLPLFVLAIRNGFTIYNYITTSFSLELTRFLVGSIGIVLAIPISLLVALRFLKRGESV